jgi:hypothetical protein
MKLPLSNEIVARTRVILEKLIAPQLAKNLPAFYGAPMSSQQPSRTQIASHVLRSVLILSSKGRKPLRRPRFRYKHIKINLNTNRMGRGGLNSSGSGQGQLADSCRHGNEILDSIKCEKFLDQPKKLSASQQRIGSMESVSLVGRSVGRFA